MGSFSWIRLARRHHLRDALRRQPKLEILEDRTVLSTLTVVPAADADGATKLGSLSAALALAHSGDIIQIEPASSPGAATVSTSHLIVQGDPASAPAALPLISQVTIAADITGTTLTNLNLGSVFLLGGSNQTAITHSLVQVINEAPGTTGLTANVITDDTIGGTVTLFGTTPSSAAGDEVSGNTFTNNSNSTPYLFLQNDQGALVEGNKISSTGSGAAGIEVYDSQNVQVTGNVIQLGPNGIGIAIESNSASAGVTLTGNQIDTGGAGEGIYATKASTAHDLDVVIADNDLSANRIGIVVIGDGTGIGTIDAGGGGSSAGGNSFLGFVTTYNGKAAIDILNATSGTVAAVGNQWSTGHPDRAVYSVAGAAIELTTLPNSDYEFVQSLYLDFLKRSGSLPELQTWVALLPTRGDEAVANGIVHSAEALRNLVDGLYVQYLHRAADPAGEGSWVSLLQQGGTEEEVVHGILASSEMQRRITVSADPGLTPDEAFVQGLFQGILHRTGSVQDLDFWAAAIPRMGRDGVAGAILNSAEARALQVELYYGWLHRPGSASMGETMFWAGSSLDLLSIQAQVAGSAEFYIAG